MNAPKTGVFHRYQKGFEFLGFRVIGDSTQPAPENVPLFADQIREYARACRGKTATKVVRGLNRRIHWFGHQYKRGRVKLIYGKLDEDIRSALRANLAARGAAGPSVGS